MEIDNISNYINYKLYEHKTNLTIFINDDYETKKLKTKNYIYKNRKLIIFGFIISVLLAYITHLENNCNYQPHKQYGGDETSTSGEGGTKPSATDSIKPEGTKPSATDSIKPEGTKPSATESTKPEGTKPIGEGTKPSATESTKPEGESKKDEGTKPEGEGSAKKEGEGGQIDNKGNGDGKGKKDGQGSMLPSGKEGKKGSKGQPVNKAADKAARKQGMGFLSGFKNINAKGGIFSSVFGAFKSVYQFFIDRIKFILYLFLSLFLFALLLISPIVFMMVVVYYMVKFLLKRQSTL